MEQNKSSSRPDLKLWVTALALVVGFLCGLAVFRFFYYAPVAEKQSDAMRTALQSLKVKLDYIDASRMFFREVYKEDASVYKKALKNMDPNERKMIEKLEKFELKFPEELREYLEKNR